ncbi:MAG: PmoA family protein [Pyrinomonadaceae bacterium]
MMRRILFLTPFLILAFTIHAQDVRVIPRDRETRVDVEVEGKLFTSFRWDERIKRPVLFPIMSAGGAYITRGFPIETRDGETINHPHQVGSSLSYGDVNGIDFWNTSTFRSAKELEHMGRIVLRKIPRVKSGDGRGEIETISDWIHPNGNILLIETTKFIFYAKEDLRWIDRITTLAAHEIDVVFGDNKEGLFAIHLNVNLQQDDQFPVKVTSTKGVISERASAADLTGKYLNSEGLVGEKIWGTPGRWASVSGRLGKENLTVVIFDSPSNHNFPSNMMVRPYGLLALNPFGQKAFVPEKSERKFTLRAKQNLTFRHRLLIMPEKASGSQIEKEYQKWIGK